MSSPNQSEPREPYMVYGNPDMFWDVFPLGKWLAGHPGPEDKKTELLETPESAAITMLSELVDVVGQDPKIEKWSFKGDKIKDRRAHTDTFKIPGHRIGIDFDTRWHLILPESDETGVAILEKIRPSEGEHLETICRGMMLSWIQHNPQGPLVIDMQKSGAYDRNIPNQSRKILANDPETRLEREYGFKAVFASYVKFCPVKKQEVEQQPDPEV